MPGRYRELRLDNAVIRVSSETIPDRHFYDCLWEVLEAVISDGKTTGAASLSEKGDGFA